MSLQNLVIGAIALVALGLGIHQMDVPADQSLGSASSPSVVNGCQNINGVTVCFYNQAMRAASTTCSFKTPSATTTLVAAAAKVTNSYGSSFDVQWGKAADAYSTTTSLGHGAGVSSGDVGTFVATSTFTDIENPTTVLAPNTYLNFKIGSSSPTVNGSCSAQLMVI